MSLIKDELKIKKLKDLLYMNLTIPSYQRPYTWSTKSANILFVDTYDAFNTRISEYRLGSVILHKYRNTIYNIVDGQQRLTTLSILLYCLGDDKQKLLNENYSKQSNNSILANHNVLTKRVFELKDDERDRYKEYLLNQCTTVQIVTDSEQEAFQFFDSQNSRGKELEPHDLLKSYHLREMNTENENQKIKLINEWENINQQDLSDLFKNYLYPMTRWYRCLNGLGYSSSKIDFFKGIKRSNINNYAIYHKASNIHIEAINSNGGNELLAAGVLNQFQLSQPLLAGKRFFHYTLHYGTLLEKIQQKINQLHDQDIVPCNRTGDIYIKQLYECSLLFFADRFKLEELSQGIIQQLYSWCYSLRLTMKAVYPQTINKYANGQHERINNGLSIFSIINQMSDPEEINLIILAKPEFDEANKIKYKKIYDLLCSWNRW